MKIAKPVSELDVEDLQESPVWEYIPESEDHDETWVGPINDLPVADLSGRVIGVQLHLANGDLRWGMLGNISLRDPKPTSHSLTVSVRGADGGWFDLARYHDVDYRDRGPSALAAFLGLAICDVFPIRYDISAVAIGHDGVIRGSIPAEPAERLSEEELIELAMRPR
jgi:hypothetical protein